MVERPESKVSRDYIVYITLVDKIISVDNIEGDDVTENSEEDGEEEGEEADDPPNAACGVDVILERNKDGAKSAH